MSNDRIRKIISISTIILLLILTYTTSLSIASNIRLKTMEEKIKSIDKIQKVQLFIPGELIIKFKDQVKIQYSQGIIKTTGITSLDNLNEKYCVNSAQKIFEATENPSLSNLYKLIFSENKDVLLAAKEYTKNEYIEFAEPNYFFQLCEIPNDPLFDKQWALNQTNDCDIDAPEAWDIEIGDSDVIIGILDSGVEYTHPDLVENIWINVGEDNNQNGRFDNWPDWMEKNGTFGDLNSIDDDENGYIDDVIGWDFGGDKHNSSDNDPKDFVGHGTHCAGIAAAVTDNGIGISGIAWNCSILPIKVSMDPLSLTLSAIANGIVYATDNNVDILSMSLFTSLPSFLLKISINYAYQNGVLLISSAGNFQNNKKIYPTGYDEVISVAATNEDDSRAFLSNYGDWVDVAAPGQDIYSTYLDNTYASLSGTSMSGPYVAGLAGLIKSKNNHLSSKKIREIILYSVDRLDPTFQLKGGRINARNALQRGTGNASSIIKYPKHGNEVKGVFNIKGKAFGEGFNNYIIEYSKGKDPETNPWIEIINSTQSIENGELCSFDTAELDEGIFIIRLKVLCNDGVYTDTIWITVNNEKNEYIVDDDGGADYTTIQDAIYKSGDGDIVRVRNGTYYENLNIFRSIKLIGENRGNTIIDGMGKCNVINILADNVQLSGFTIRNSHNDSCNIFLEKSNKCIISCNKINNSFYSIKLESSKRNLIYKNYFINYYVGVRLIDKSNRNLIQNNNFWTLYKKSTVDHASFKNSMLNKWQNNYWQRLRILPYRIPHKIMGYPFFPAYLFFRNNFDWRPALKPHEIPSTSSIYSDSNSVLL